MNPARGHGLTHAFVLCFAMALANNHSDAFFFEDDAFPLDDSLCDQAYRRSLPSVAPPDAAVVLLGGHTFTRAKEALYCPTHLSGDSEAWAASRFTPLHFSHGSCSGCALRACGRSHECTLHH